MSITHTPPAAPIEQRGRPIEVSVIYLLPESFRKKNQKLFAKISALKKQNPRLEQKNEPFQQQIEYLYHFLKNKKKDFL